MVRLYPQLCRAAGWPTSYPPVILAVHPAGASTIYREQGQRLIAIKFGVRGRDLAGTVAEARAKVDPLLESPYRRNGAVSSRKWNRPKADWPGYSASRSC